MSAPTPMFSGEVQFRRYSDTSTQGQQIVLALADREALSAFIGKEGKRFMAVLVEIGDDEQPVEPVKPARKDTRGPLCKEACDYCAMLDFQQWVCTLIERGAFDPPGDVEDEEVAKRFILRACDVGSRKHLDEIPAAADRFISNIRVPFMRWQRQQRRAA